MSSHKLNFTFEVLDDDMPSERRLQYRDAIIAAMSAYQDAIRDAVAELGLEHVDTDAVANAELIDKLLEDCYR